MTIFIIVLLIVITVFILVKVKDSKDLGAWLIVFPIIPICIALFDIYIKKVFNLALLYPIFALFIIFLICSAYELGSIKKRYYMANVFSYLFCFAIIKLSSSSFSWIFLTGINEMNILYNAFILIGNIMIILTLYFVPIKDINVITSIFKFKKIYFRRTEELHEFISIIKTKRSKEKKENR
jgi:hypothetical protein